MKYISNLIDAVPVEFWFIELGSLLIFLVLALFLVGKNAKLVKQSKLIYLQQQQLIKAERQRISGEIHDDIGSGLFSIRLYADLASKKRVDVKEIKDLSLMVNDMSDKINEIIWSTNTESDHLENLLYYIEHQMKKLFVYTNINFEPKFTTDIPDITITSQSRRNIYLLVKEIVYNALRHSEAKNIYVNTDISNGFLIFEIKDDGIGFNPNKVRKNSRGLKNVKYRIEQLRGNLIVENYKGTRALVKIPLNKAAVSTYPDNAI